MIDDIRPTGSSDAADEKQKPLDIFTQDDGLKSAAVQRPEVDVDKLEEMMGQPEPPALPPSDDPDQPAKQSKLVNWWQHRSKMQRALLIIASLVLLGGVSGGSAYMLTHGHKPKATAIAKKTEKKQAPVDTRVPSQLSGLLVDPALNNRPVVGVMIENSLDARPQSGLDQASVVFEAIAEGGITRFLALFQDTQPDYVGPVRSVRPYYQTWALGFDAPMAHVGGSPEALANIKPWGVKDLDQFYNSGSYRRVSNRAAPHNVYTTLPNLTSLAIGKGYTKSTFTSLLRKKPQPYKQAAPGKTATDSRTASTSVNLAMSSPLYNVSYSYDAATNSYKRTMGGKPHVSVNAAGASTQISPSVVVALVIPYNIEADGKHSFYATVGSGQAFVFQDGTVTLGTWSKAARNEQIKLTDSAGKPLGLNPGQTWITAVKTAGDVTYR